MGKINLFNAFAQEAGLNAKHGRSRREHGLEIACFEIAFTLNEISGINMKSWWDDYIGVEFMGIIHHDPYLKRRGVESWKEIEPIQMIGKVYCMKGRRIPIGALKLI